MDFCIVCSYTLSQFSFPKQPTKNCAFLLAFVSPGLAPAILEVVGPKPQRNRILQGESLSRLMRASESLSGETLILWPNLNSIADRLRFPTKPVESSSCCAAAQPNSRR